MINILLAVAVLFGLSLILGLGLIFARRFMEVEINERLQAILDILPGINCGVCGFSGCGDYAEKLEKDAAEINLCIPGGKNAADSLGKILGKQSADVVEMYNFVRCRGHLDTSDYLMDFDGPQSCKASHMFYNGRISC